MDKRTDFTQSVIWSGLAGVATYAVLATQSISELHGVDRRWAIVVAIVILAVRAGTKGFEAPRNKNDPADPLEPNAVGLVERRRAD